MTISKTDFAAVVDHARSYLGPMWGADVNEVLRAHGAPTANPADVPEGAYKGVLQALETLCGDRGLQAPPSLEAALMATIPVCVHGVRADHLCTQCHPVSGSNVRPLDTTARILAERGKRYGRFDDHARITQRLKGVVTDEMNTAGKPALADDQQEALDMIFHKIGRIINGDPNYADSWADIAGYARLVADRLEGQGEHA